jgi:hypothetical protein
MKIFQGKKWRKNGAYLNIYQILIMDSGKFERSPVGRGGGRGGIGCEWFRCIKYRITKFEIYYTVEIGKLLTYRRMYYLQVSCWVFL